MVFNWMVIGALIIAYVLFGLGVELASRPKSAAKRLFIWLFSLVLALPGVLMVAYYAHWFDDWTMFYQFRSMRFSEWSAGGVGLLGGLMAAHCGRNRLLGLLLRTGLLVTMTLGILAPHIKPVLVPAAFDKFTDRWDGAVCRQSTGYSCGAASAATLLRYYGIPATELELAHECFTCKTGTENWYLARALRKRGLRTTFYTRHSRETLPVPCIAGTRLGSVGHFIAILERRGDTYLVGNPLRGEEVLTYGQLTSGYAFTGFFLSVTGDSPQTRARWATPLTREGVPNLHRVSDTLYRSAQPTAEGMKALDAMGIETVVNLRSFHSDRDEIAGTGLAYEHIYMKAWHPEEKEVVRFLQIVTDPKRTPVLVHCMHGADRTGTMTALYRIVIQGWSKADAINEMRSADFNYHEIWVNLPQWIDDLDIDSIRRQAGLVPQPDASAEQVTSETGQ